MADDTHDVGLPSLFVDGVAHGIAVDREALVSLSVIGITALERTVECVGINPNEQIANDAFAGNETLPVLDPTAEALACLGAQILGPPGNGLVAVHAAQGGTGGDGQDDGQRVTPALRSAWVWNVLEVGWQGGHVFDSEHDFGRLLAVIDVKNGA